MKIFVCFFSVEVHYYSKTIELLNSAKKKCFENRESFRYSIKREEKKKKSLLQVNWNGKKRLKHQTKNQSKCIYLKQTKTKIRSFAGNIKTKEVKIRHTYKRKKTPTHRWKSMAFGKKMW